MDFMDKNLTKKEVELLSILAKAEEQGVYMTEEELVREYYKTYGN